MTLEAIVTYTKDGHKKKARRWFDGKLKINVATREGSLYSEEGQLITTGKIPADVELVDDSDEFVLEKPSILCVISSIDGNNAAPAPPAAIKENTFSAGKTFRNPLPSAPSAAPLKPRPALPQPQRSNAPLPSATTQPTRAAAQEAAFRPPVAKQQRSAADIMRLLSTKAPSGSTSVAAAPPPVKRQCLPSAAFAAPLPAPQQQQQQPVPRQNLPPPPPAAAASSSWQKASSSYSSGLQNNKNGGTNAAATKWDQRLRGSAAVPLQQQQQQEQHDGNHISIGAVQHRQNARLPPAAPPPGSVYFPTKEESNRPLRRIAVPDRFPTVTAYQQSWENSLCEEITLRIAETAKDFHSAVAAAGSLSSSGAAAQNISAVEAAMRKHKVLYHSSCELFIWKNIPGKTNNSFAGGRKRKKGADAEEDDDEDSAVVKPEQVYLILKSGRAKNVDYSKGDVWIVSNDPLFRNGFDPGQVGDRRNAPWVSVVRSLWFGPNQDGKFEVEFLSSRPHDLGRKTPVYALKGPNASTELALLDLLRGGSLGALPLLPALLGSIDLKGKTTADAAPDGISGPTPAQTDSDEDTEPTTPSEHAEYIIKKFRLNPEQASVVRQVAKWAGATADVPDNQSINPDSAPPPPVCLVFGPFGCGKSSLLVAILHLILALRKSENDASNASSPLHGARVLVSAHTNVAVDRVLMGLLESGCTTEFLRVGPLRRIDRTLLPYSLHASESKANATAAAELKDMLREGTGTMSPSEEAALRAELAAAERGAERQRKKLLKTVPVVGVTCCSALLPVLESHTFDIVILDECSQIIEPLAMAPILRAKARFLIAAGDPKQLPPVIAHPPLLSPTTNQGLLRPLFVRLSDLGACPNLLRRQYRCHPAISAVPNARFYEGRLLDGCNAEDRPSLLTGHPTVMVVDVRGQEERRMRSTANMMEAHAVAKMVERALSMGVDPGKIGVICFYRAQVAAVKSVLQQSATRLQAAVTAGQEAKAKAAAAAAEDGSESAGFKASEEDEDSSEDEHTDEEEKEKPADCGSIQVATVDAFQGAEKDVIILTTAATRPGAFAGDAARLNVALTRAKNNLVVVGCAPALERTAPAFADLLKAARKTAGGYVPGQALQ